MTAGVGDKSALFLRGGLRGALCLHGFTGTPFEVRPVAEALAVHGYTASAPVLAGHCLTVQDLAPMCWPDWQASAEAALDQLLAATTGPVAIAGFSMGSLLALRLARKRPNDVAALAIMAPPLRLKRYQANVVRLLAGLPKFLRRGPLAILPKFGGYDVVDQEMKSANPGLPGMPVAGIVSLIELGQLVIADLPHVATPTLVVHGTLDRTVPLADTLEVADKLGSAVVERLMLPQSGHLVAIDVERATLVETIIRFFDAHLPAAASARAEGHLSGAD